LLDKVRPAQIKEFLNSVKLEMRKVSWPGRKEVYGTTIVVIGAVFFFGIYLGLIDLVLHLAEARIFRFFR